MGTGFSQPLEENFAQQAVIFCPVQTFILTFYGDSRITTLFSSQRVRPPLLERFYFICAAPFPESKLLRHRKSIPLRRDSRRKMNLWSTFFLSFVPLSDSTLSLSLIVTEQKVPDHGHGHHLHCRTMLRLPHKIDAMSALNMN